ncbi:hypothetical protein Ddye_018327 [Dipteronia dyeriana]|uniref:Uncharacterized protein n=1 Tax=Dipteronia dyeriana TaxID=168575 RepID=A0AAD9X1N9_9ROSI|nr:hypothetical protein Ddye_018327 [Dipteronia dyeriana]
MAGEEGEFYLRYYVGHKGKFGHEFLEFEFRPDGKLRYANNSNYKNDTMIRKEVFLTPAQLQLVKYSSSYLVIIFKAFVLMVQVSKVSLLVKEVKIVWEMNMSHSPLRRLVLSLMFRAVMIQKGFAYFIILFRYIVFLCNICKVVFLD